MADDTERERRDELARLEVELERHGREAPFPVEYSIRRWNEKTVDLQRRIGELKASLPLPPTTGAAAGTVFIDGRLGSGFSRPGPASEASFHVNDEDPLLREYGESIL